jgi:cell division protease FtsH
MVKKLRFKSHGVPRSALAAARPKHDDWIPDMKKNNREARFRNARRVAPHAWAMPPGFPQLIFPSEFDRMAKRMIQEHCDKSPVDENFETDPDEVAKPVPKKKRLDAMTAIVGAAFEAAVSKKVRRRLSHPRALAVVVLVPTSSWVAPTTVYFRAMFGEGWTRCVRDGSNRSVHKSSVGSDEVALDLSRGRCVVGLAADVGMLPAALVMSADITIRITVPTGSVLRTAITRFARRSPGILPDGHALGLDLNEIVAAFRPGSGPQIIARRLATAAAVMKGEAPDEVLPELANAVEYGKAQLWGLELARDIADYRAGKIAWSDLPRGICLHGEPGSGKSLYARILSRACSLPLVSTSVADWFTRNQGYLNDVINAMRAVFAKAAALAPCILMLDEIDSVPNRATLAARNADYWKPLVNDLLLHLDNAVADTRRGIIVVGATNNIAGIDAALLRPGRLELPIEIERPDFAGTLNVLRHHVRGCLSEAELGEIAVLAERSTGAEIMHLVREGRRIARHAGRPLEVADLRAVLVPQEDIPPDALWRICVHEAGHAVAALAISHGKLRRCIIGSKNGAAGHTLVEHDDGHVLTRQRIEGRAIFLLSGRAAERVVMTAESIGAGGDDTSDLAQVTKMIGSLHVSAGMGETIAYVAPHQEVLEAIRADLGLRARVERDLQDLQRRAVGLIRRQRTAVVAVATALVERRHLSGDAVREIFDANTALSRKLAARRRSKC